MSLKGIKVLELEAYPPLALCGQMLADQGASVTMLQPINSSPEKFQLMTEGKHLLKMDLKKEREKFLTEIIPELDVLMESYRPGVMEKLGLSPEVCHKINPKLIYVRLSGFGQMPSSYQKLAGHDGVYLAITGVFNKFKRTPQNSKPVPPLNILADYAFGSLYCFQQILQAIVTKKQRIVIDSSLTQNSFYLSQLEILQKQGKDENSSNFTEAQDCVYQDKDGKQFVLSYKSPYRKLGKDFQQDENGELAKLQQDSFQLSFQNYTIEEIKNKYGDIVELKTLEEVLEQRKDGLVRKDKKGNFKLGNVFEPKFEIHESAPLFKPKL